MLNGGFANLPPDSWKPFGNGIRGCIGRPFAWQESLLIVAMVRPSPRNFDSILTKQIFQSFDLSSHNPNYQLKIKQTLTVKPDEFYMHVTPRKGRDANMILGKGAEKEKAQAAKMGQSTTRTGREGDRKWDMSIYYGK